MEVIIGLICLALFVAGFVALVSSTEPKPVTPPMQDLPEFAHEATSGISVKDKRGDRPKFERLYERQITPNARVKVRATTYYSRSFYGEVTQPNGRWVLFDPDSVADKIFDPILVPLIEQFCREVRDLDRQFMASNPSEFTDETGQKWRRAA